MRATTERLRADARSNREQIVAAAQLVFRERGVEVSMKDIADRAGVGVGTLYRRFPDRESLISAAAHDYLSGLAEMVASVRREEPDAWSALARFLRDCAELRLGALASAVEPALHADIRRDPALTEIRATVADRVAALAAAAHAEGTLRADVTVADVARLMTMQLYTGPEESYTEVVRRVMDLVLDGLRAR